MELQELVSRKNLKSASRLWLHLLRVYFRLEIEGLENLPHKGAAIIIPNHSGFAGADAVLLAFAIKRETRRRPRLLAHRAFFDFSETLKHFSEAFGLRKASVETGIEVLKNGQLVVIFPEGEQGNFKPSARKYQLQRFHTGFLRMAVESGAPIVPCLVIGAEETHFNLGNVNLARVFHSRFLKGLRIPLPLNLIPLPAKWRFVFLPPLRLEDLPAEKRPADGHDLPRLKKLAAEIQSRLQKELRARVKKRPYIYFAGEKEVTKALRKKVVKARRRR